MPILTPEERKLYAGYLSAFANNHYATSYLADVRFDAWDGRYVARLKPNDETINAVKAAVERQGFTELLPREEGKDGLVIIWKQVVRGTRCVVLLIADGPDSLELKVGYNSVEDIDIFED